MVDFGKLWKCLGGSWGSSAFRNLLSGQVFEEGEWKRASKETARRPKRREKAPKRVSKAPKMRPKGSKIGSKKGTEEHPE